MKNNLIIGGSGLIGKALFKYLKKKDLACLATSTMGDKALIKFDLKTPEDIKDLELDKIGTVYITAAISSPDICNTKFDYAWSVNVEGTSKLIEILLKKEIKIIFLSTDTVYGDHRKPFDETMDVNPIGKYGFMKNHIEKLFLGHKNFKSVRLSYVFSKNDNFTSYLLSCFCNNREAEIFHPFFRSIIYLDELPTSVTRALATDKARAVHLLRGVCKASASFISLTNSCPSSGI